MSSPGPPAAGRRGRCRRPGWPGASRRSSSPGSRRRTPSRRRGGCSDGLLDLRGRRAPSPPSPRLLGAFDPLLLGWASREPVTGPHERAVVAGGLFRPFALVAGRAAAAWKLDPGRVVLEPCRPLTRTEAVAPDVEAKDVERFLAGETQG